MTFLLVPGGEFLMGSNSGDADEAPPRRVVVRPILLSVSECTQLAWVAAGGVAGLYTGHSDRPISGLHWGKSRQWCAELGLRLPSEAEWEYACRAELAALVPPASQRDREGRQRRPPLAWLADDGDGRVPAVMRRLPNQWGFFDMLGGVGEWCEDVYHSSYDGAPSDSSAWTSGEGASHIVRGGSYASQADARRPTARRWLPTRLTDIAVGFRPACSLPE